MTLEVKNEIGVIVEIVTPKKLVVLKIFKTIKVKKNSSFFSEHFLSGFFNKNCLLWLYSVYAVFIGNLDEIS